MNVELLIHAIVRQTTILIAQLATAQGIRAPLAQIADQVFAELVRELDRHGVSRKVSADMFGMGLRTYRRKVQKLGESSTLRGRSLWETVFEYIKEGPKKSRNQVLTRFSSDDVAQVKAVLHDLCASQLIVASGSQFDTVYRESTAEESARASSEAKTIVGNELLVALLYREGPRTLEEIGDIVQLERIDLEKRVSALLTEGRLQAIESDGVLRYRADTLMVPLGAANGWEGAVFDHFKALVATVQSRLRENQPSDLQDQIGGSTYTFAVWPGHPLEAEVRGTLRRLRGELGDLQDRVNGFNEPVKELPDLHSRVVVYLGQNVTEEEKSDLD